MTRDADKFTNLKHKEMRIVCLGNTRKLKVLRSSNIYLKSNFIIKRVLYLEYLQFNLLSISQFWDSGYKVEF